MENAGKGAQFGPGGGGNVNGIGPQSPPPQVPLAGAAHAIGAINNGAGFEIGENGNGIGAGLNLQDMVEDGDDDGPEDMVEDEHDGADAAAQGVGLNDQVMVPVPNQFAQLITIIRAGGDMIRHHAAQLTVIGQSIGVHAHNLAENHIIEIFNRIIGQVIDSYEHLGWIVESMNEITPEINNTALLIAGVNAANVDVNVGLNEVNVALNDVNVNAQGHVGAGHDDVEGHDNVLEAMQNVEQNQAEEHANNNNDLEQLIGEGIQVIALAGTNIVGEAGRIAHIGLSLHIIADVMAANNAFINPAIAHIVEQMRQVNVISQGIAASDKVIQVAITIAETNFAVQGAAENQENAEDGGPAHENDNEAIMQVGVQAHVEVRGELVHLDQQGLPVQPNEEYNEADEEADEDAD